ncbi:hypothetical protein ACOMICROBIO_FLGHMIGD_03993 [Vibrio sp. B1FLJ16]|uniref:hypothetical protein n=1 Tax=Vibrio sp. B1FLJ16 TaxID=2751178 RepID=UPI0015F494A2|nr:hypothetical protein [Vibrio sp. B1FLJ16]CAD7819664.1 hypothetical protein ACOMICROBIO_FLGHMIGD_03993 [Vibrio sp. B1FLJ16]CAE6939975.1 hypothetical protein ACOMICROBIO_FLGHMIGD_03993 [Vibrio sp. B1FLJ16]
MKQQNILLITLLSVSALWGCDSDDNDQVQVQSGVYEGVIWASDASPSGAQIVVQQGIEPQLTLWDAREHQLSYLGTLNDDQIDFSAASVSCEMSDQDLVCTNANGSSALTSVSLESADIGSYAGTYQARYSDALYQMSIDESGSLSLTGSSCNSEGSLVTSGSVENLVMMELTDEQCIETGTVNIVMLEVDNDSLDSINVQTDSNQFPQVWIKL